MKAAAERYIRFFSELSPAELDSFGRVFAADACFKDPFNDVRGLDAIRKVFAHMYATTRHSRFLIRHHALDGHTLFICWDYHFDTLQGKPWHIPGTSVVQFGADGKALEHVDYWDPAEHLYSRITGLGTLMRWLRKRLAA